MAALRGGWPGPEHSQVGGFHAEAMEKVDDGKAARGLGGVGGRQVDEDGFIGGIAEGISWKRAVAWNVWRSKGGFAGRRGERSSGGVGGGLGAERDEAGEDGEDEEDGLDAAVEHGAKE